MKRRKKISFIILASIICYIISYCVLSRNAFEFSKQYNIEGFYFFNPPRADNFWRITNYGLVILYYPLIYVDNKIGWGMPVAHEPMWKVEKKN